MFEMDYHEIMKRSRPLLTLILSLLIPMSSFAGLETDMGDCPLGDMPMEAGMTMMMAMPAIDSSPDRESPQHPCCQDPETVSRTGQLCNPGQECGAGISLPSMEGSVLIVSSSPGESAFAVPAIPSAVPDELLRPPSRLS